MGPQDLDFGQTRQEVYDLGMDKMPGRSMFIPRDEPDTVQKGDLVTLKKENGMLQDGNTIKYRTLAYIQNEDGESGTVWVGPPSLDQHDIDQFTEELTSGMPRSQKFAGCKPVNIDQIQKVLDS